MPFPPIVFPAWILLRALRCFQESSSFVGNSQPTLEDVRETKLLADHGTVDGHLAVIKFKNVEYILTCRPITSTMTVERPLMVDEVIKNFSQN